MTKKESEMFLRIFELIKTLNLELSIKPIDVGWRVVLSSQESTWHIGEGMLFSVLQEILTELEE